MKTLSFIRRILFPSVLLAACLILSSCTQDEVFERAKKNAGEAARTLKELGDEGPKGYGGATPDEIEENARALAARGAGRLSKASKKAGAVIIVSSEVIGILLYAISSRAKAAKLKKSAIMTFIVGIPLLTVASVYGLAILAAWFEG